MPFPFRNPVNSSYDGSTDDGGSEGQVDPKLEAIVQKMIDAGESEENIAAVIKQYKTQTPGSGPTPTPKTTGKPPNPDDEWWKGFEQSLTGGEAAKVSARSLMSMPEGAFISGPMSGLSTVAGMFTDPKGTADSVLSGMKSIPGTVMKSGSDPESFGDMMGQFNTPMAEELARTPTAGKGMQAVGNFVAKNQPVTGMVPPMVMPRTFRLAEKGLGQGLSKIGDMLNPPKPPTPAVPERAPIRTPFNPPPSASSPLSMSSIDLNEPVTPRVNNASGESSASLEALSRQKSMKNQGQQYFVFDKAGQGRPIIGPDAVDYNAKNGETYGILSKDGSFQKLDDKGGKVPSTDQLQAKAANIQDNIDKKYGKGNTDKASPTTQKTLSDTKQATPVLNRPGTIITVKNATPEQIQQAQRLGYQIESRDSLGNVRFKQTGRPMTISSAPTNTSMGNIDLNTPINIGGGS